MCSLLSRTIAAEWCTLMSQEPHGCMGCTANRRSVSREHGTTLPGDRVYGHHFIARVEGLGVEDVPISARSPWQNCYAERVIGSIRRECLDHVVVINERHLRRILKSYFEYYHRSRTHLALQKAPAAPGARSFLGKNRSDPRSRRTPSSLRSRGGVISPSKSRYLFRFTISLKRSGLSFTRSAFA